MFIQNKFYREYLRLLFLYSKVPRYQGRNIKFLEYEIFVPDCLSFIFQFKEIFVKQYYNFKTESKIPIIFDCGSNIGISVIFFKSVYKDSKIKAFEADKVISEILRNNLIQNKISGVEIIPKAVWTHNEGVEFYSDGADAGSIFGKSRKVLADSIRLKEIIDLEEKIDMLKLDVEGAETEVLVDIGDNLKKVDNLFIEFHSFKTHRQSLDMILSILNQNNFRYFINSVYEKEMPFINKINPQNPDMDLQLNIFAYKSS